MRKWWREAETEELTQADLARINARAAVPIEVVGGDPTAVDSSEPPPWRVRETFLAEDHHPTYGRPWAMGKFVFQFAVEAGLRPEHRLLDFGCGALRLGVWAIPYLEVGNYFGVDAHLPSLEAAATYEIPFRGLEPKRPRLLWNEDFQVSHFGTTFDYVIDYSSARRVKDVERRKQAFSNFADSLVPGGKLLTNPRPGIDYETFAGWGLRLTRERVRQECPFLAGHDFKSHNAWWEFVRN